MNPSEQTIELDQLAKNLAGFAIDRTDLKELLATIPRENALNLTTVEYELGILKILSVGWAIAFYMPATDKHKVPLTETFWEMIREIAQNISNLAESTSGTKIDYFLILKERLDAYVKAMQENQSATADPSTIMGPAFAMACKATGDPMAVLTGTKMFTLTLGAVKEYLGTVKIKDITLH